MEAKGGLKLSSPTGCGLSDLGILRFQSNQLQFCNGATWQTVSSSSLPSLAQEKIWVGDGSNAAAEQTPSGDVSLNAGGHFTVQKIQGQSVLGTVPTDGAVMVWNPTLTRWEGVVPPACSQSQALHWNSARDSFQCVNLSFNTTQLSLSQNRFWLGNSENKP